MEKNFYKLDERRMNILPKASGIMERHSVEVFRAMNNVLSIMDHAFYDGLEVTEKKARQMQEHGDNREKAFGKCMEIYFDTLTEEVDIFMELFDEVSDKPVDEYICYIYLRGFLLMRVGAGKNIREAIMLSLLPEKYREIYRRILEKRR